MANNKVRDPQETPGRSEFNWGPNLEARRDRGAERSGIEQHRAQFRTDSLSVDSVPDYDEWSGGQGT